jgi:hypothetical protein
MKKNKQNDVQQAGRRLRKAFELCMDSVTEMLKQGYIVDMGPIGKDGGDTPSGGDTPDPTPDPDPTPNPDDGGGSGGGGGDQDPGGADVN